MDRTVLTLNLQADKHISSSTKDAWDNLFKFTADGQLQAALANIKTNLKGKLLVDIGCGREDFTARFANEAHAQAYVGVDVIDRPPFHTQSSEYYKMTGQEFLGNPSLFPKYRKLEPNFVLNGIELSDKGTGIDQLVDRMIAKMSPGNYILGVNSPAVAELLAKRPELEAEYVYSDNGRRFFAYRFKDYDFSDV